MAYVPANNLKRLIRNYYRQLKKPMPKELDLGDKAFLIVQYQCDSGYRLIDEIDSMFCSNKIWVSTQPVCRGTGAYEL